MNHYTLNDRGEPVMEPDLITWANWLNEADRRVGGTNVNGTKVSTVFLGLDHSFEAYGAPILWETMVFRDGRDVDMERCGGSREQAEAMHAAMVRRVERGEV